MTYYDDEEPSIKTTETIDVNQVMRERTEAFQTFQVEYEQLDPQPEEVDGYSIAELGLKFLIVLITGIAAVLQAAMRTGAKFMELAALSNWDVRLQWLDGITAMVGVEGIVFMAGWIIGSKKKEKNSLLDSWELYVAGGIALLISIITGAAQAVTGSESVSPEFLRWLDFAVLALLGPGASILAFFAGELVGIVINEAQANAAIRVAKWQDDQNAWKASLIESWRASEVYKMLNIDVQGAAEVQAKRYRVAGKQITASGSAPSPAAQHRISLRKHVDEYFANNGYAIQDIGKDGKMTAAQLNIELGITAEKITDPATLARAKNHLTKVLADMRNEIKPKKISVQPDE